MKNEGKLSKILSKFFKGKNKDKNVKKVEQNNPLHEEKHEEFQMHLKIPNGVEVFRKNRFAIEFPGIPSYYFNSYSYIGTDVYSQKKLLTSSRVIFEDYSVFKVVLFFPGELDICKKLKELEDNTEIGDVKIHMLDPAGTIVKTILIPDCEIAEIKAFRELEYKNGAKDEDILFGEIIVKHKQRKFL